MPYEIITHDDHFLYRLHGRLTITDFLNMAAETELVEAQRVQVNRLVVASDVESYDFGFEELLALTSRRARVEFAQPSKTAIIASGPLEFGLARMFQSLNQNPQIEVRIVATRAEAMDWFAE